MSKVTISRPINGISINGDEYLLHPNGIVMEFDSKQEAINFLQDNGYNLTDEEIKERFNFHTNE